MTKRYDQFTDGDEVQVTDEIVGLRSNTNTRFDFPGAGIKDSSANWLIKWTSGGALSVNYLDITSSLTGQPVIVQSNGTDADVALTVKSNSDGALLLSAPGAGDVTISSLTGDVNLDTAGGLIDMNSTTSITGVLDEDTMSSDSATHVPTQQSTKAYVDASATTVSSYTYVTNTDETVSLPNSQALSALATGMMSVTTTTGIVASRTLTGTANEIDIANGDGSGTPTWTLSATIITPGTLTLGGTLDVGSSSMVSTGANDIVIDGASGQSIDLQINSTSVADITSAGLRLGIANARITTILDEDNMASDSDTAGVTQQSVKAYVDTSVAGAFTWSEVTGTSQAIAVENGYIANNVALVTLTLPATASIGDTTQVQGKGAGLYKIAQNAGQTIHFGSSDTTTGVGGSLTATNRYDSLELVCITANTDWAALTGVQGIFTVV